MNSRAIGAARYTRLAEVHTCPALSRRAHAAPGTATSRSASSNTMRGSTLPSSRFTFLRSWPAWAAIRRPAATEPVNAMQVDAADDGPAPRRWRDRPDSVDDARRESVEAPSPCSRFESGFWCGGLQTSVFPAASAGATFQAMSRNGKLNGTMAATTR